MTTGRDQRGWTRRRGRRRLAALAIVGATVLGGAVLGNGTPSAQANDIAGFTTIFGTNVVHAGFGGMRGNGTGTLTVAGVSGPVTKAYLYWQGPTNSTDATANASVTFNGNPIVGTNVGFTSDNCWGFVNSQAYRADVTPLVSGNGAYTLSDFVKGTTADVNGASLLVFFDDGNAANNRDVVLFDGNDSNITNPFDANGWNVVLPGINYTSGSAAITLHVADGQTFGDDALNLNSSILVPAGAVFSGDSVPSNPSTTSGSLWDIKSYDITSFLSPGPNTLTLTTGLAGDCLSLVVAAIDLPAGAAPPPPGAKATTTTYTSGTSVQYSDPVALAGRLNETIGGAAVPGKTLSFTIGAQSTSAGPTDSSGAASTSLVITQQPGSAASVATAFAGDSSFTASSDNDAFTIAKEDCTLTYSGDVLVAPATTTRLAVDMGEPDTSLGDRSAKSVTFTLTDAASNVQTFTAVTDANGHAETTVPVAAGVYGVAVSFAGDSFYLPCATSSDTIVTVQAAGAKVTGGGWIASSGRTSFGFNAIPDATGWKGQFQLRVGNSKAKFHGNTVTSLTSTGANSAMWRGTGRWNGVPGYTYEIAVVDNGSSAKKTDTISIVIRNPVNVVVYASSGAELLKGGNITVH